MRISELDEIERTVLLGETAQTEDNTMYMDLEAVDIGTVSRDLTVEECLAELRQMFPGKVIFLKDEIEWWAEDDAPCRATVLGIDYPPSKQKEFKGDSLADCMAQVRQWHKEQK